jgi:hypothetical protein
MSTIKHISSSVALLAMVLVLPVAAEEQVTTRFKEHTGLQPVTTQRVMPVRAGESLHSTVI